MYKKYYYETSESNAIYRKSKTEIVNDCSTKVLYEDDFFIYPCNGSCIMNRYHIHHGYEINLCIKGSGCVYLLDKSYDIMDKTLTIFGNSEFHRIIDRSPQYSRFVFFFNESFLQNISKLTFLPMEIFSKRLYDFSNSIQLDDISFEYVIDLCDKIYYYYDTDEENRNTMIELIFAELLIFIGGLYKNRNNYLKVRNTAKLTKAQPIIDYIRANLQEPLSLEDLCKKFYLSKSTLIDIFNDSINMAPNKFIIMARISKAKYLLLTGFPIPEICFQTGFNDQSHFSRTFKNLVGVSPKKYSLTCLKKAD